MLMSQTSSWCQRFFWSECHFFVRNSINFENNWSKKYVYVLWVKKCWNIYRVLYRIKYQKTPNQRLVWRHTLPSWRHYRVFWRRNKYLIRLISWLKFHVNMTLPSEVPTIFSVPRFGLVSINVIATMALELF